MSVQVELLACLCLSVTEIFDVDVTRDGTTDVTRTMHFGTPSEKQRVSSYYYNYGLQAFVY